MPAFFSVIAAYLASLVRRAVQCPHHLLCILFRHFDVALFGQQVDVSYLLMAVYVLVDELHHLARIESVGLAEVDEQPSVAALCLALAAAASGLSLSAAAAGTLP